MMGRSGSVIVGDLHIVGVPFLPEKADPPLIVDPDRLLAGPVALEGVQPVAGRNAERIQSACGMEKRSFWKARCWISPGKRVLRMPFQIFSATLSAKLRITNHPTPTPLAVTT